LKMYFSVNIVIFLVICNYGVVRGADPVPCPVDASALSGCKCYPLSRQIRCEDPASTSIAPLALTGQWEYLYIHNTQIVNLAANTFEHAQFKQIFISENNKLTTIEPLAFGPLTPPKTTTVLEIRQNNILTESGLFEIAKSCAANVITIGFDGNKIGNFNGMKFDNTFAKLESLNLNNQHGTTPLTLPVNFILSPPLLHQLSLDYNRISTITDTTSIDLTSTKPVKKRISIFLNDNTLSADHLIKIKLPSDTTVAVGLDIENNKVAALNVAQLEAIAKSGTSPNLGNVYLKGNTITTCDCTSAGPLRRAGVWERFQGLDDVDCGGGKLALCPAP
jgi:hypothetical protein